MVQLITTVSWTLNNYCRSECSYCPSRFRNGEEPRHISNYIDIAKKILKEYSNKERIVNWVFNGGELLDMFDFPEFLKFCKTSNGTIELTTNGGRLWLDWWAIEPYIDILNLSYHYWQNFNLIKYIIQLFQKNNKQIRISIPIRPGENFMSDWNRAKQIDEEFNIFSNKMPLFKEATSELGFLDYTEEQFEIMFGKEWVYMHLKGKQKSFKDIQEDKIKINPSFTGKLCNVGIEYIFIGPEGWVNGSICGNTPLGNIWQDNFLIPDGPSKCKMVVCSNPSDQKITKFN